MRITFPADKSRHWRMLSIELTMLWLRLCCSAGSQSRSQFLMAPVNFRRLRAVACKVTVHLAIAVARFHARLLVGDVVIADTSLLWEATAARE